VVHLLSNGMNVIESVLSIRRTTPRIQHSLLFVHVVGTFLYYERSSAVLSRHHSTPVQASSWVRLQYQSSEPPVEPYVCPWPLSRGVESSAWKLAPSPAPFFRAAFKSTSSSASKLASLLFSQHSSAGSLGK